MTAKRGSNDDWRKRQKKEGRGSQKKKTKGAARITNTRAKYEKVVIQDVKKGKGGKNHGSEE